jgi:L-aspartate oxidase
MVTEGPDRIHDLIEIGTRFTQKDGSWDLVREGGHSMNRILHAKDLTGKEVERALIDAVSANKRITVIENAIAIDLITEHNVNRLKSAPLNNRNCWGAYVLDVQNNQVLKITSKATVLATGGLGQVYLHTTNPGIATGDGFAMAYRAGARIANMEFIQFHPTALYNSQNINSIGKPAFLISEAVRGHGGILRNRGGERFMEKYDNRKELAPRDIVARAIDTELKKSGDEYVCLDITHIPKEKIIEYFPNIYQTCLNLNIDITKEPIPVVPSAHYACGGILVDECSRSSLTGLYACGEVAMTGVHGANRLASNSLLEAVVFSHRAAGSLKNFLNTKIKIPAVPEWDESGTLSTDEKVLITHSIREIKQIMWDYVGIVRSNLRLERASQRLHNIYNENESFYKRTKVFEDILGLRNISACAHMIIKSAQKRKESRGLHYTIDYPEQQKEAKETFLQNTHP